MSLSTASAATTIFLLPTYDSKSAKDYTGWNYTSVLTIALPIMFTALGLAVTFAIEVALKIQILSVREEKLPAGTPGLQNPAGASPVPGPVPGQTPGLPGNKYADNSDPSQPPQIPLQNDPNAGGQIPPPPLAGPADLALPPLLGTVQPGLYVWEELLILLAFHVVSCSFYAQPRASSQNALGPVLAWIHFVALAAYAFIIVDSL